MQTNANSRMWKLLGLCFTTSALAIQLMWYVDTLLLLYVIHWCVVLCIGVGYHVHVFRWATSHEPFSVLCYYAPVATSISFCVGLEIYFRSAWDKATCLEWWRLDFLFCVLKSSKPSVCKAVFMKRSASRQAARRSEPKPSRWHFVLSALQRKRISTCVWSCQLLGVRFYFIFFPLVK